jgi:hypothetical protein
VKLDNYGKAIRMLRDSKSVKDILLASAIILVLVASRADGQVRAALLTRSAVGGEDAIAALEESREALLEARDAIDAALRRVDETLASLGEARPRERVVARAPEPVPARLPSARDLSELSSGVRDFAAGFAGGFVAWRFLVAPEEQEPVPAAASHETEPRLAGPGDGSVVGESAGAATAPAIEAAALTGAGHAGADVRPSAGTIVEQELPGLILDAAGAMIRVLEDAAARAAREAPVPDAPYPRDSRVDGAPAEDRARPGVRDDR